MQALLSDMSMEVKYDYDRLVAALTNGFKPPNQCELYKAQIKQRIHKACFTLIVRPFGRAFLSWVKERRGREADRRQYHTESHLT